MGAVKQFDLDKCFLLFGNRKLEDVVLCEGKKSVYEAWGMDLGTTVFEE